MTGLKFGSFCLGLAVVVGIAVVGVGAQGRGPSSRVSPAPPETRSLRTGSQLGVMVSDLPSTRQPSQANADSLPSTRQPSQANADSLRAGDQQLSGVRVDEVDADSAAEKAGLKAGDVVVEFDGERVRSARQFTRLIQETPDGRTVKIAVLRDGKRQTLDATPEARSFSWSTNFDEDRIRREFDRAARGMREFRVEPPLAFEWRGEPGTFPGMMPSRGRLGVTVESLSPQLADYFGVKDGGALVSSVTRDSAAEKAGIKAGDVITSVNGGRVRDAEGLSREIGDATGTELSIGIVRDKKETTLKATLSTGSGRAIEGRRPDRPRANSRPGLRL